MFNGVKVVDNVFDNVVVTLYAGFIFGVVEYLRMTLKLYEASLTHPELTVGSANGVVDGTAGSGGGTGGFAIGVVDTATSTDNGVSRKWQWWCVEEIRPPVDTCHAKSRASRCVFSATSVTSVHASSQAPDLSSHPDVVGQHQLGCYSSQAT